MQAVLISSSTRDLIAGSTHELEERMLDFMLKEFGDTQPIQLYFVPRYEPGEGMPSVSWATLPKVYLDENYMYDASKIDTEFVDIIPKTESRIPA